MMRLPSWLPKHTCKGSAGGCCALLPRPKGSPRATDILLLLAQVPHSSSSIGTRGTYTAISN